MELIALLLPTLLLTAAIVSALWVGGGPERLAALGIAAWAIIDPLYRMVFGSPEFARFDASLFVFDLSLATVLVTIALKANRNWPIFAAGTSLLPIGGHLAAWLYPSGMKVAYWALNQIPFLLIFLSVIGGATFHRLRKSNWGSYPDWTRYRTLD